MIKESKKADKPRNQIFHEAVERLSVLLSDHPHFRAQIALIREKLYIPEIGVGSEADVQMWKRFPEQRARMTAAIDALVRDFRIRPELRSAIYFFVHDYILLGSADVKHLFKWGVKILRPSGDFDHDGRLANLGGVTAWVGIDPSMTKQDVLNALKHESLRPTSEKNFGVPKFSDAEREAWKLSEQGRSSTEIKERFKELFPKKSYSYANVTVLISRYRKALRSLRPLK